MRYLLDIDKRIVTSTETMNKNWALPVYVEFVGDFNEENSKKFRNELEACEQSAIKSGQEVIPVVIDSYGGSVISLFSMIDTIQNSSVPIATIVEGHASSAGAFLFSFGAEGHRYIAPNGRLMIHGIQAGARGAVDDIEVDIKNVKEMQENLFRMLAKNCGKHEDYFWDKFKLEKNMADWHLSANEALKHNIANKIGIPSFKTEVKMNISFGL